MEYKIIFFALIGIGFMIYCYMQTEFIGFIIVALGILILALVGLYKPLKNTKNKKILSKTNSIQISLHITEVSKHNVFGIYNFNGIEHTFKSRDLEFDIEDLVQRFNLVEVPLLISPNNPKVAILDENFLITCMKKRNESINIISEKFTKNDANECFFGITLFLVLSIITLVIHIYLNSSVESEYTIVLSSLLTSFRFLLGFTLIYCILLLKKIKKLKGIMVVGYVEAIVYHYYDGYTHTTLGNNYYTAKVSYVYQNKIYYVTIPRLSHKFDSNTKFLPVYIYPNYPAHGYVDTSLGYRK